MANRRHLPDESSRQIRDVAGAKGVLTPANDFNCLGQMPAGESAPENTKKWFNETPTQVPARRFLEEIDRTAATTVLDMVFEHPARRTYPSLKPSCGKRGGMRCSESAPVATGLQPTLNVRL